jgi:hypothetical protein
MDEDIPFKPGTNESIKITGHFGPGKNRGNEGKYSPGIEILISINLQAV